MYTLKESFFDHWFESKFDTGRIFAMGHSRQVMVQVMIFQILGYGVAQDIYGGKPNSVPDSNSSLSGLLNEVLFVSEFISDGD